jgi:outer membrane receptor for ferrienterochelin and colicin
MKPLLIVLFLYFGIGVSYGQIRPDSISTPNNPTNKVYEVSVSDLLKSSIKESQESDVSIASRKVLNIREAPGIVTVITREEILKMGARDLIDILHTVPGFHFGTDVTSVVGVGIRGNWAHEGKFLLQLNGISLNETLFATSVYGNRFPVEAIQRIEIIRGPGSAIYGGYAELGVINIITQTGEEINGVLGSTTYSRMVKSLDRANGFLTFGKKQQDLSISMFGFYGEGNRSDANFSDFYGNTFSMGDGNSKISPRMFHLQAKYKNLDIKFLEEVYHATQRTGFYINLPNAFDLDFHTRALQLNYPIKLSKNLTLTPKLEYTSFMPYHNASKEAFNIGLMNPAYKGVYENTSTQRLLGNTLLSYDPSDDVNIIGGFEIFEDKGDARNEMGTTTFANGKTLVSYINLAGFAQGLFRTKIATFTVGGRIDNHSEFGSAFAPRLAMTKAWKKAHAKILFSNAFRQPSIQNITLSAGGVRPEKTNVLELEVGYSFDEQFSLKANVFNTTIRNPIVYLSDDQGERYENFGRVGTRGFEVEGVWKSNWGYWKANYSFYGAYENTVPVYAVPINGEVLENEFSDAQLLSRTALLGMPQHKIASYASINISKTFSVNPTVMVVGRKYGYNAVLITDTQEIPTIKQFNSQFFINLNLTKRDFLMKGLHCAWGVHNLLNQETLYIQPYNGFHAPLPGASRSFMARVSYQIKY